MTSGLLLFMFIRAQPYNFGGNCRRNNQHNTLFTPSTDMRTRLLSTLFNSALLCRAVAERCSGPTNEGTVGSCVQLTGTRVRTRKSTVALATAPWVSK